MIGDMKSFKLGGEMVSLPVFSEIDVLGHTIYTFISPKIGELSVVDWSICVPVPVEARVPINVKDQNGKQYLLIAI